MKSPIEIQYSPSDWTLTSHQMHFLVQNHNAIEAAFAEGDLNFLREFASSSEFQSVFGDMGFDEAYDRYEEVRGLT
jgi:hypothetical protein